MFWKNTKLFLVAFLILMICTNVQAQSQPIKNKNGLNLYASKSDQQPAIAHIAFGDSLILVMDTFGNAYEPKIMVDSIEDNWSKVEYNGKTDYLSKAFVIPYKVPRPGTERLRAYTASISKLETPHQKYHFKDVSTDDFDLIKIMYTNGIEADYYDAYESTASTYFLPAIIVSQGFALLRLFSEFELLNENMKGLPTENQDCITSNNAYVIAIEAKKIHIEVYGINILINTAGFLITNSIISMVF